MTEENRGEQGESVPLNWACTNCGYSVEGELPEQCPECGAESQVAAAWRGLRVLGVIGRQVSE